MPSNSGWSDKTEPFAEAALLRRRWERPIKRREAPLLFAIKAYYKLAGYSGAVASGMWANVTTYIDPSKPIHRFIVFNSSLPHALR